MKANITLKQLEAFYLAANAASFASAAARLHVTQSSLSKRISELEAQLGQPLFDRTGHKAVLTEAGRTIVSKAQSLLMAADELRSTLSEHQGMRGQCRFGVGEHTSLSWLPDFVSYNSLHFPDMVLEPSVNIGSVLEDGVDRGQFDFAVVAGMSTRASMANKELAQVEFSWVAARSLVGDTRELTSDLIRSMALITMPPGAGAARTIDQWLMSNNLEVGRRLICNSMAAIMSLVIAGLGISLLPVSWLLPMEDRASLVRMKSNPPIPLLRYYLTWRRDDNRHAMARLRDVICQIADFDKPISFL